MNVDKKEMEIIVEIKKGIGRKKIGDWCENEGKKVIGNGIIKVVEIEGIEDED